MAQSTSTVGISAAIGGTPTSAVTPTPPPVGQAAPPQTRDERYFNETNFRIGNDAFWNYFTSQGGVETFGFPVSRVFGFLGCPVQIFQRSILQQCGNTAPVALLNLLDPELFPYTRVNGSVFPGPDDAIKNATPPVSSPTYNQDIIAFVERVAVNTFEGQPVNFGETFDDTGGLEIWGAPISNPAYDPSNRNFIYQRFQRGIMHYTTGQGTRGILLADYLKAIMLGPDSGAAEGREPAVRSSGGRAVEQAVQPVLSYVSSLVVPSAGHVRQRPHLRVRIRVGRTLPGRVSVLAYRSASPTRMRVTRDR